MDRDKPLVIYHGQCKDGFCSAWVFHRKYGDDVEFFEGFYGQPPPDVTGRDVVMVDFCYPRDVMEAMVGKPRELVVLDHHKTAAAAMEGFEAWAAEAKGDTDISINFNMDKSGAMLAWDHCFPTVPVPGFPDGVPWIVQYVQDRDLWRHQLPDSMAVNAYISTMEFSFDLWDETFDLFKRVDGVMVELGKAVLAKTEQYVREVRKNALRIRAFGYTVPIVNAPQVDVSELGHALCEGEPFSIAWWQRSDGLYQYSLRSREDGMDVSVFAKIMAGGGHKHAAGFMAPKPPPASIPRMGLSDLGTLGLNPKVE